MSVIEKPSPPTIQSLLSACILLIRSHLIKHSFLFSACSSLNLGSLVFSSVLEPQIEQSCMPPFLVFSVHVVFLQHCRHRLWLRCINHCYNFANPEYVCIYIQYKYSCAQPIYLEGPFGASSSTLCI